MTGHACNGFGKPTREEVESMAKALRKQQGFFSYLNSEEEYNKAASLIQSGWVWYDSNARAKISQMLVKYKMPELAEDYSFEVLKFEYDGWLSPKLQKLVTSIFSDAKYAKKYQKKLQRRAFWSKVRGWLIRLVPKSIYLWYHRRYLKEVSKRNRKRIQKAEKYADKSRINRGN